MTLPTNKGLDGHRRQPGKDWSGLMATLHLKQVFAHELAQPVSALAANAVAARNMALECRHTTCRNLGALEDLVAESEHLCAVFQRVRALARGDLGVRRPEEVNLVIKEALVIAKRASQPQRIVVKTRLARNLPPIILDSVQIQQVILNLLGNAFDSVTASGTTMPVVEVKSRMRERAGVEIAIKDNGTGIPEELVTKVTRDFVTTKPNGNGIGLLLCRVMIERHGGTLTAQNNRDCGATFRINLPLAPEHGP